MSYPPYSVLIGFVLVCVGAYDGIIESTTIFADHNYERAGIGMAIMAAFALLIAVYKRSKGEMFVLCAFIALAPFVSLWRANKWSREAPLVPSDCFELGSGVFLVVLGAVFMFVGYAVPDDAKPAGDSKDGEPE